MNVAPVPEIDAYSALTALAFLGSVMLLMWERYKSSRP